MVSITEQEGARLPNARREANKLRLSEQGISIELKLYQALKDFA